MKTEDMETEVPMTGAQSSGSAIVHTARSMTRTLTNSSYSTRTRGPATTAGNTSDRNGPHDGRSHWCALVRQSFDRVPPADDVHERHSGNLAYPSAQLAVARRNDEAFVRRYTLHETIVRVGA